METTRPRPAAAGSGGRLIELAGVTKRYGSTQALAGVDLEVGPGEILGLVGHNGAGKSTLMRVICGITEPNAGKVTVAGRQVSAASGLPGVRALGVQIAFQELSLPPTVRVLETTAIVRPTLRRRGWRRAAARAVSAVLDEIFPNHGISPWAYVESLSLAQRQMLEIANALVPDRAPLRVLILDEPTSAIGQDHAVHLFSHLESLRSQGVSTILISHKMREILDHTTRTLVMRDGKVIDSRPTARFDAESVVEAMSSPETRMARAQERVRADIGAEVLRVSVSRSGRLHDIELSLHGGEIVGLAGLDGQGQQELLYLIYRSRRGTRAVQSREQIAFVSGDRQRGGIFPLWTTGQNIAISAMGLLSRAGVVDRRAERATVDEWMQRLAVRGTGSTPMTDLSGGNQQKVLIARALASPARIVLLDDPFRGVDVETRQLVYQRMSEEAANGRAFLWFTTENVELAECRRVLVMSHGEVTAELAGDRISEEAVITASFASKDQQ